MRSKDDSVGPAEGAGRGTTARIRDAAIRRYGRDGMNFERRDLDLP
ncbi:hypothetical protein ACWGID_08610 [Kribbella sp. NPDC054772]